MRHPSSQALYALWDRTRGADMAPARGDLPPEVLRPWLGDIFVLGVEAANAYPLRVAGTRVCALLGRDGKGQTLLDMFETGSRCEVETLVSEVAEEELAAVAGLSATGSDGASVPLELLLLPIRARSRSPHSILGLIVPLAPARLPVGPLALRSWRYSGHQAPKSGPRPLRKTASVPGFTVYEGLP